MAHSTGLSSFPGFPSSPEPLSPPPLPPPLLEDGDMDSAADEDEDTLDEEHDEDDEPK
jgi:hypothetical protein